MYSHTHTHFSTHIHATGFFACNSERKIPHWIISFRREALGITVDACLLAACHLKNDYAHSIHKCIIKQLKWKKQNLEWQHHLPMANSTTPRYYDHRIFRCQNVFISISASLIYAKNSNITVNRSFSTHFCILLIKFTVGFRGHYLYQLHILNQERNNMHT